MNKIFFIALVSSALVMTSCIEETFPTSIAIESQLESSPTAIESMVSAIPTSMLSWQNNLLEQCGYHGLCVAFEEMTTDVVIAGTNGYNTWGTYSRMHNPLHNRQLYSWYMHYAYVRNANNVIGLIDKDTQDETMRHYLGIAYAYRAFYYLNLVRMFEYKYTQYCKPTTDALYGLGVPIVTEETTEAEAKNNPRVTVEKNYEMIFDDLQKAETYLTGYTPPSKAYPTKACVYGLFAKAYLERGTAGIAGAYEKAAEYARKAINESGCTPLTQSQWEDPVNGFNNATSQNSWMWASLVSTDNTSLVMGSFYGLMVMEQTWIVYGWGVGRALSRKTYEAIPNNDFRKYSWLDPVFFDNIDSSNGDTIWTAQDSYNGHTYKLAMPADVLRGNITRNKGWFLGYPYLYLPIKFRPHDNDYATASTGAAMDFPLMRVEEMYLIEAEAKAHTNLGEGKNLLNAFMSYRITDGSYDCSAKCTDTQSLVDEIIFQKRVEFWGEGINYFDAKRLELGVHRGYKGINAANYNTTFDLDGIFPQWNCRIPEAEQQGNPAVILNPIPDNAISLDLYWAKDNSILTQYYGCDLDNPDGN